MRKSHSKKGVAGLLRNGGRIAPDWVAGLVRKTHLGEELAPKPHCAVEITQNLSISISSASHFSIYRQPTTTLGTAAPLYKTAATLVRLRGLVQHVPSTTLRTGLSLC